MKLMRIYESSGNESKVDSIANKFEKEAGLLITQLDDQNFIVKRPDDTILGSFIYNFEDKTFSSVRRKDVPGIPLDFSKDVAEVIKYFKEGETEIEESNTTSNYAGGEGPQRTPFAFRRDIKKSGNDKVFTIPVKKTNKWSKPIFSESISLANLMKEISYPEFKTEGEESPKKKINSTIQEVNRKLMEVERYVKHLSKLKTEIGADQRVYYKDTIRRFGKMSERLNRITSLVRELNK